MIGPRPVLLALLAASLGATGCARHARRLVDRVQGAPGTADLLAGRVQAPDARGRPVVVAALTEGRAPRVVAADVVGPPDGTFLLVAPPGTRRLLAFVDEDGDGRWRPPEPAVEARADAVDLGGPWTPAGVEIALWDGARVRGLDGVDATGHLDLAGRRGPTPRVGGVGALSSPRYADEAVKAGMWDPAAFFSAHGPALTMLEEYDPSRIPVLFVHGAGGGPRDFDELLARIDRRRFQAWVYNYATAASLRLSAAWLDGALRALEERHGPRTVYLVAHSMGGLVSRRMLLDRLDAGRPLGVSRVITLATPWSGNAIAGMGARNSPVVLEMWRDMDPEGDLVGRLFERRLGDAACVGLAFAYAGNNRIMPATNDGAVSLESVLRPEAQREARKVWGVNASHDGILRDPATFAILDEFLGDRGACAD